MMLSGGRLRERITIRRFVATPTGKGGQTKAWETLAGMDNVPAEVIGQGGREAVISNTLKGIATYRITIRYRPGIKADDQIIWTSNDGLELNILAPPNDPMGDRKFLEILANTSSPQGAGS